MNELASRLRAVPPSDLSLAVGGVALGIGAVLAYGRMSDSWADFPLLLLFALPCAVLFALALAPGGGGNQVGTAPDGRLAPWQTACLLVAIPLLTLSIVQLLQVLGDDNPGTGTATWVFLLTGLCAVAISVRLDSPGATVLAALLFAGAGLTAVNWADENARAASYRDVLLIEGVIFLLLARSMWDARASHAKQLVAVAGIVLIAGAVLGNYSLGGVTFLGPSLAGEPSDGWTLILIAVTIGMLAFAAWQRHGGSALVGLIGLLVFLFANAAGGDLSGWPLLLGVTALACIGWVLVIRPSRSPGGAAPSPQPPPT